VTRARVARSVALVALVASCIHFDKLEDYPCPDAGTPLTYQSFGEPFLDDWCTSCHNAAPGERQGAPEEVRFDDIDDVREWKARIFLRSALGNDSMPPGTDDPPASERKKLAEWLACGAPE